MVDRRAPVTYKHTDQAAVSIGMRRVRTQHERTINRGEGCLIVTRQISQRGSRSAQNLRIITVVGPGLSGELDTSLNLRLVGPVLGNSQVVGDCRQSLGRGVARVQLQSVIEQPQRLVSRR